MYKTFFCICLLYIFYFIIYLKFGFCMKLTGLCKHHESACPYALPNPGSVTDITTGILVLATFECTQIYSCIWIRLGLTAHHTGIRIMCTLERDSILGGGRHELVFKFSSTRKTGIRRTLVREIIYENESRNWVV